MLISDNPFLSDNRFEEDYITHKDADRESVSPSTVTATIPNNIQAGDRYLLFVTDYNNQQYETDETNNVYSIPITIEAPNLKITKVEGLESKVFVSGSSVGVRWTVINESDLDANAGWRDQVYISTDEILDDDDRSQINRFFGSPQKLLAGEKYTESAFLDLPDETGKYYLLFKTDYDEYQGETNELDNIYSVPIEIVDALPNLTVTDATAPAVTNIGHTITATWTTKNIGDSANNENWSDHIYLSDDRVWDENDELISSKPIILSEPFEVEEEQPLTSEFTIPETTATGSRYLLFVADGNLPQPETREDDNVFFLPIEIVDFELLEFGATNTSDRSKAGYKFSITEDTLINFDSLTNNSFIEWSLSGENGAIVEDRQFNLTDGSKIENSVLN